VDHDPSTTMEENTAATPSLNVDDSIKKKFDEENKQESFKERSPKLYAVVRDVTFHFAIPIFTLYAVLFLCGYMLAFWESNGSAGMSRIDEIGGTPDGEKATNDFSLETLQRKYRGVVIEDTTSRSQITAVASQCSTQALEGTQAAAEGGELNITLFNELVSNCAQEQATALVQTVDYQTFAFQEGIFDPPFFGDTNSSLTFDWTECSDADDNVPLRWVNQAVYVFGEWNMNFGTLYQQNQMSGMSEPEAFEDAVTSARGHDGCGAHTPGGALYWYSITTSTGFGPRILSSNNSRILIYFCGIASFCLWFALLFKSSSSLSQATNWMFTKIDYCEKAKKVFSVVMWLGFFWLMVFIASLLFLLRLSNVYEMDYVDILERIPIREAFWLHFNAYTTLGLGDYSFPSYGADTRGVFSNVMVSMLGYLSLSVFLRQAYELYHLVYSEEIEEENSKDTGKDDKDEEA